MDSAPFWPHSEWRVNKRTWPQQTDATFWRTELLTYLLLTHSWRQLTGLMIHELQMVQAVYSICSPDYSSRKIPGKWEVTDGGGGAWFV